MCAFIEHSSGTNACSEICTNIFSRTKPLHMHPTHEYLLFLLHKYESIKSEKYILSRLFRTEPKITANLQTLFCPKCVMLFIPVVNCSAKCHDRSFSISCKKCTYSLSIDIGVPKRSSNEVSVMIHEKKSFRDLFS